MGRPGSIPASFWQGQNFGGRGAGFLLVHFLWQRLECVCPNRLQNGSPKLGQPFPKAGGARGQGGCPASRGRASADRAGAPAGQHLDSFRSRAWDKDSGAGSLVGGGAVISFLGLPTQHHRLGAWQQKSTLSQSVARHPRSQRRQGWFLLRLRENPSQAPQVLVPLRSWCCLAWSWVTPVSASPGVAVRVPLPYKGTCHWI